jgi:hypothetical protein
MAEAGRKLVSAGGASTQDEIMSRLTSILIDIARPTAVTVAPGRDLDPETARVRPEKGDKSMRIPRLLATVLCASLLVGGVPAFAANDHLKCYKAREIVGPGKVQYTATLVSGIGLNTEPGCLIKGPARLVCTPVSKTSVSPTPPGGGPTATTRRFFCYKIKCAPGPDQTVSGTDQFGGHTYTIRRPKTLCLPASPSGAFIDDASLF